MESPKDILRKAALTFEQRNALYGDNHMRFGRVMQVLFPDGVPCRSADDFTRLGLLVQCVSKLTRYTANFNHGGHQDSAHDLCVYAAMLESVTVKDEETRL